MDETIFDEILAGKKNGGEKGKPQKRVWREIEALKDKQRLRKELADIDLFDDIYDEDLDY
ncbi:DUF3545 family protein [Vibrio sp. SS-MA-C1-2]|uniref:DUF3545 family protein n=1 Tax=Vibrio sp. SS-MA-C1-2 TaxID=2908646 RepID=UPI001F2DBFE8|nr:DUF3545 family protein [Vibrio sp. SS-MA-C1-2]UJF19663.1 DUF3545 family protein [Vibrio sp. SS-MA-C1-2]